MTTGMDKKNYQMPSEVTEERHDDAVNSTEPDLTSYYEAAAAAASSGHEFHPDGDREHTEVPPEGNLHEKNEELSDGTDRPTDGNLPDVSEDGSPHGPLALFSDEEKNGEQAAAEENGPAHPQESVPAYAAFQAPENAEEQEDEDDGQEGAEDDAPMSIMGHLNELRRRLFRIVIIVILGFVAFYGISEPLYGFLSAPLKACMPEGSKLIYTSPQGAFFTYMKVALVASLFGTSPFSFYQLWAFIAPGLYREEKRAVLPLAFFSSVFFLAGASFCFFLVFPIAFQFFMGFATETIVPMISVEEYLSFALKLLIAFGLVFEMPLFAYFLSRFGLLTPEFMRRSRRYAILVIFIVAAILTPPDVFSQCLMAMPMLVLYEVSIYVSAMAYRKKPEVQEETAGAAQEKQS